MAGSPSASLRPPGHRRPRSRRRGKGAIGGRFSGFPCGAAGSGRSGTPLPFPSPSRCFVRAFSANGARGVRRMRPQVGPANLPLGKWPVEASGSGNAAAEAEAPSLAPCSGQRRAAWGAGSLRSNKHLERCEIGNHESSHGDPGGLSLRAIAYRCRATASPAAARTPGSGAPSPPLPYSVFRTVCRRRTQHPRVRVGGPVADPHCIHSPFVLTRFARLPFCV